MSTLSGATQAGKYRLEIGKQVRVSPHNITQRQLLDVLSKVPDASNVLLINYWVDVGDKKVYIEGWSDKCIAGWGYPKRHEEGAYDTFFEVGERLTPEIIQRKASDNPFYFEKGELKYGYSGKTDANKAVFILLEGGWVGTPNAKNLYGITYGIYEKSSCLKQYSTTESLPLTYEEKRRKTLAAFLEMGEWYVKHRRLMPIKDIRAIGTKYFGTGDDYTEFLEYFVSSEGLKEFRHELRQILRDHGISMPPEEEWLPLTELEVETKYLAATTGQKYVSILSPGQTVFSIGQLVSREWFDKENERVRKLGENPATGEVLEDGKWKRIPQTSEKLLPALKSFIKVGERVRYLDSGIAKYRQDDWPEGSWMEKGIEGTVVEYHPGLPEVRAGGKYFEAIEAWATVRWDHGGKTAIDPDGEGETWERIGTSEKLLPALKPFDPYKFADYVLRNNVFSDKDTFVYSGLSGTNPHRVPDHYWAEALADMQGEFVKTGDLYVVHTPGVERPPTMRAAPTWREPSGELSLETIELLAETEGDPIRKFCCRQCGECAPAELLEEGRFLDRITWLRSHYKEKHPGIWGKMASVVIPTEPSPPSPKDELEFVSDSPEYLAFTIEDIGYREKLDTTFETAIARAKGR